MLLMLVLVPLHVCWCTLQAVNEGAVQLQRPTCSRKPTDRALQVCVKQCWGYPFQAGYERLCVASLEAQLQPADGYMHYFFLLSRCHRHSTLIASQVCP
jgi:hypothetical protein